MLIRALLASRLAIQVQLTVFSPDTFILVWTVDMKPSDVPSIVCRLVLKLHFTVVFPSHRAIYLTRGRSRLGIVGSEGSEHYLFTIG